MGATAIALLRAYRRTAWLLAATLAVGLGAGLPLALVGYRLSVRGLTAPLTGLWWQSEVTLPTDYRQRAMDGMASALRLSAGTVVLVALLTLLALAAARMAQREREVAVRRAVGASRRMLVGGFALEGAAIAIAGAVCGLALAVPCAAGLRASWPAQLTAPVLGPALGVAGLLVLVVIAGALFPLAFARRPEVTEPADAALALKIPALLLGCSLAVLATGVLLSRHMRTVLRTATGAAPAVQLFPLDLTGDSSAARAAAVEQLLGRLTDAGIGGAAAQHPGALMGLPVGSIARADCEPCSPFRYRIGPAGYYFVSPDSFQAMGVRLVAGRGFSPADRYGADPVAIVNETFAAGNYPGGDAVGQRLSLVDDFETWYRIVGVVADGPARGLGAGLRPASSVYLDVQQHPPAHVELTVPDGPGAGARVTTALAGMAGVQLAGPGRSGAQVQAAELAPLAWSGPVFSALGVALFLLATVGTFALVRLWVLSRTAEVAVWRAVGAPRRAVYAALLGGAARAGGWGVFTGLWLGPLFWQALRLWVPGLGGWEAGVLLPLAAWLLGVTVLGAFLPTRGLLARPPALLADASED